MSLLTELAAYLAASVEEDTDQTLDSNYFLDALRAYESAHMEGALIDDCGEPVLTLSEHKEELKEYIEESGKFAALTEVLEARLYHQRAPVTTLTGPDLQDVLDAIEKARP